MKNIEIPNYYLINKSILIKNLKIISKPIIYINNKKIKDKKINIKFFINCFYLKIKNIQFFNFLVKKLNINIFINLKNYMIKNIKKIYIKIYISTNIIFYNLYLSIKDKLNLKILNKKIKLLRKIEDKDKEKIKYIFFKKKNEIYTEFWDLKINDNINKLKLWSFLNYKKIKKN